MLVLISRVFAIIIVKTQISKAESIFILWLGQPQRAAIVTLGCMYAYKSNVVYWCLDYMFICTIMCINIFTWEWRGGWTPNKFPGPKIQWKSTLQSIWLYRKGKYCNSSFSCTNSSPCWMQLKEILHWVSHSKSKRFSERNQLWRDHLPQTSFWKTQFLAQASKE